MADKRRQKRWGWALLVAAVALMVAADEIPNIGSFFVTVGAMVAAGFGMYFAFDDR